MCSKVHVYTDYSANVDHVEGTVHPCILSIAYGHQWGWTGSTSSINPLKVVVFSLDLLGKIGLNHDVKILFKPTDKRDDGFPSESETHRCCDLDSFQPLIRREV